MPSNSSAVFTIAANNYLHFARTLTQSARRHHPDADVHCVIADRDMAPSAGLGGEFSALPLDELQLPGGEGFRYQYSIVELNTALKPWAFEALLDRGYSAVTYLDPDIYVYGALEEPARLLDAGADIVLTPHLLAPISDDKRPGELDIRRAGTYNLGFCALRESANTRRFLEWWQSKLEKDCVLEPDRGVFVDQSWIDLVPGLFANVAILRDPGYNVAYWNIAQRRIERLPGGDWQVESRPLAFFHFSGFDPFDAEAFSRQQDRFRLADLGAVRALALEYADRLVKNGAANYTKLPYGFGSYTDGTPVPDIARKAYRDNRELRAAAGADPFMCRSLIEQYLEKMRPRHGASVGENRVHALFWTLLGRAPEQEAVTNYAPRCETYLGFLQAWKSIALSRESRAKRLLASRMLKALSAS